MTTFNRNSLVVCFVFALGFLTTLHLTPYPFAYLVKSIPILILSVTIYLTIKTTKGKLLSLGFLFSGIGDIVLEYPTDGLFVYGIGAFLIAHLFYISVFLRKPKF